MSMIFYTCARMVKVLWKPDSSHSQSNANDQSTTLFAGQINKNMAKKLLERRKVAKMLISVAIMFAICYLPIHLLNIARYKLTYLNFNFFHASCSQTISLKIHRPSGVGELSRRLLNCYFSNCTLSGLFEFVCKSDHLCYH